jgi:hypothetical protein
MLETLKKFKYLIIIVLVLVAAFIGYTIYTSGDTSSSSALQKTVVDGSGNIVSIPSSGASIPDNDLAKTFVDQLLIIRGIEIKTAIFKDPVFLGLVDNHKGIDPQLIGRPNPFAPVGKDVGPEPINYQDVNGTVIQSTNGVPVTEGSDSNVSKNSKSTISPATFGDSTTSPEDVAPAVATSSSAGTATSSPSGSKTTKATTTKAR